MIRHLLHKPNGNAISVSVFIVGAKRTENQPKLKHLVQIDWKTKLHIPQEILQQWPISIAFRIALCFTRKTVKSEKELLEENATKSIRKVT